MKPPGSRDMIKSYNVHETRKDNYIKDKQRACRTLNWSIQYYDPCTKDRISDWIYLYEARGDSCSFTRLTIADVKSLSFEEAHYLRYVRGDTRAWSG